MATDIREEIDKFIVTQLETSHFIETVTRNYAGIDSNTAQIQGLSHHELPAVIVNSGNEVRNSSGPAGRVSVTYSPELVGYIWDEDEYFTKLNRLIKEVKKIIYGNYNVVYNAVVIAVITEINSIRIDRGRLSPLAVFSMELGVRYNHIQTTGGELD